jgi:hypothetical protein
MLIFYVDECGDPSLKTDPAIIAPRLLNGTSPFFVLAGVGVRDTSRKPLAETIFELKRKHFGLQATAKVDSATNGDALEIARQSLDAAKGSRKAGWWAAGAAIAAAVIAAAGIAVTVLLSR